VHLTSALSSRRLLLLRAKVALTALSAGGFIACRSTPEPAAALSPPTHLCRDAHPVAPCRAAAGVESWLRDPGLAVLGVDDPRNGIQGARVLTLLTQVQGGVVFRAKWRPYSTRDGFNDPLRELAAHAIQKLFLDPHEYVVPPAAGHCFPLAFYQLTVDENAKPTFPTVPCVYGILSYWLEDAQSLEDAQERGLLTSDERVFDPARFRKDEAYNRTVAHLNMLTYLIRHADSHPDQFLVAGSSRDIRVYSIDNSVSFGPFENPGVIENWSKVLVPAFPRETLARLEELGKTGFDRLATIEQYAIENGQLVPDSPIVRVKPRREAVRWIGRKLQVGLTRSEINGVRRRLRNLLLRFSPPNP
jgi:hypothetical protein